MENEGNNYENSSSQDHNNELEPITIVHSILQSAIPGTSGNESHSFKNTDPSASANLPGAVSPFQGFKFTRTSYSKSEHDIDRIALDAEFAKSLLLSSISFAQNVKAVDENPSCSKTPPKLRKHVPIDSKCEDEVRKIIISCLKLSNTQGQNHASTAIARNNLPEVRNGTVDTSNEAVAIRNTDESFVTNVPLVEVKVHKNEVNSKRTELKSLIPNLLLVPGDSLSSIGSNVCRICMTKGRERLISPCHCKGSMANVHLSCLERWLNQVGRNQCELCGYTLISPCHCKESMANVHLSCLERWLNQVGRNQCELCGYTYPAIRTPRYTIIEALRLWFGNPRNRNHLQSDCLIFWLLSTVTAGLLAVCVIGAQYFVVEGGPPGRKDEGISHRFTETAMDFFMAIVLFGYSLTVYLLWRDHYVQWSRWRRANVNVRLLLSPDASPVPFLPRPGFRV